MKNIDLNKYKEFVNDITSSTSKNTHELSVRLFELDNLGINSARLLTASLGLSGESGEFNEIIKKIIFHNKAFTPEVRAHLKKELGDIFWYMMQACLALDFDPNEVIGDNVSKLEARHPNGAFDPYYMDNRKVDDV